jgi:iron complex outermembrane receptor protein
VVNVITKSPWDESGVALDVRGGQQDLLDLNGRIAGTVNDDVGWKVTGQYMTAIDYTPPTGGANASDSTHFFGGPNFDETDLVEDYDIESIRTEASLYYQFGGGWQVEGTYGYSENDNFGVTNNGRNRIKGWQVQYQSLRVTGNHWFAQATHTSNDAGDTYQINGVAAAAEGAYAGLVGSGVSSDQARQQVIDQLPALRKTNRFVDKGELWDSELQYSNSFQTKAGTIELVTGGQYRRFLPDSEGTFLADAIGRDIDATEVGGYLQLDYRPTDRLRINAAARVDNHSEYSTQFSPKAAVVYTVAPNHNVRAGYTRAFKSPTVLEGNLFIPTEVPSVADGYFVNSVGNYTGFEIQDQNGDVIRQIDPLDPEEVNSLEVGYKGVFGDRLFVDVVAYNSWYSNFISPLTLVADGIEQIPFYGSGEPVDAPGDDDVFNALNTYVNFGTATVRGLDAGMEFAPIEKLSLSGSLSLIELSEYNQGDIEDPLLLNVPNAKVKGSVTMRDVGLDDSFVSFSGRWKSAYEFRSGYWDSSEFYDDGEVPSRFTASLTGGYTVPDTGVELKASVTNLFDTDIPDVLGAPETGRLLWVSATYKFQGLNF